MKGLAIEGGFLSEIFIFPDAMITAIESNLMNIFMLY